MIWDESNSFRKSEVRKFHERLSFDQISHATIITEGHLAAN